MPKLNRILLLVGILTASANLCWATFMPELPLPTALTRPQSMTYGADNFYWFTGYGTDQILRLNPLGGGIVAYQLPTSPSNPYGIITVGSNVWFTETTQNRIGLLYTNKPINGVGHTLLEFPIHGANNLNIPCGPAGITLGPDTNLWFVEARTNKVGVFSPATHKLVTEYFTPFVRNLRQYYNIVSGPDGNLWFTDTGGGRICAITTNGLTAVYPLGVDSQPFDIVVGPDSAIWFTEFGRSRIGRLSTNCFTAASFAPNGDLSTNINTSGVLTEITVPISAENAISTTNAEPYGMASVTNGTNINVWFIESAGSSIDRVTSLSPTNLSSPTNYIITRFPTITPSAGPSRLASGAADVNIWFDEGANNAVGLLRLDRNIIVTPTAANIPLNSNKFNGTLATFKDLPFNAYATNYNAVVDWGDGITNILFANAPLTNTILHIVTNAAGGGFKLNGTHTYTNGGSSFPVNIKISSHPNFFTAGGISGTASLTLGTAAVPSLNIATATNGQVVLSWTTASTNIVLQENTSLGTTNWSNVTNVPVQAPAGTFTVTLAPSGKAFFRLKAN